MNLNQILVNLKNRIDKKISEADDLSINDFSLSDF